MSGGTPTPLPIDAHLSEIVASLRADRRAVLCAPPGTGKTTRVPPALVDGGIEGGVLVLEPRRLAARAAAARVASERGQAPGEEIGYVVRHERKTSARTRVTYLTEGVLLRRLVRDPFLEGVGAVVLDEFHERHLEGDLVLAMLREVRETVRPDLAVCVMSATLEAGRVAEFLDGCQVHSVASPMFDVAVVHETQVDRRPMARRIAATVARALDETAGHVLVFLPGVGEIKAAADAIGTRPEIDVLPLHGQLDNRAQDAAVAPSDRRKVVLATNIAETSLTIDGVTAVVDSGQVRRLRHDPRRGLDVLAIEAISRASAEQRRGRAGRTGPGVCYRLWSVGEERGMAEFETPEVRRCDIAGAVLAVRAFSSRSPAEFGWFEAPRDSDLEAADRLLDAVGALTETGGLGDLGVAMLDLPLHPRLARVMVEAQRRGVTHDAATAVALLSERDIFERGVEAPADILELVRLWRRLERDRFAAGACRAAGVVAVRARAVARARDQIAGRRPARGDDAEALVLSLLAGYPDRVAALDRADGTEGRMVGGRGVVLSVEAAAAAGPLFLALETADPGKRARARTRILKVASLELGWLEAVFPGRTETRDDAELDAARGRVVNVRRTRFDDLVLAEARGGEPDPDAAQPLLRALIERDPWRHVDKPAEVQRFVERVRWLREREPDLSLPSIEDAELAEAAAGLCAGLSRVGTLRSADLIGVLRASLPGDGARQLDRLAPDRLALPSGRRAPVDYGAEAGPTVAASIQELFGMRATPRLGGGTELVLQLLAPNRRPVQVTRDLASFWVNVYPKTRTELSRRYPKHHWPEDPIAAEPRVLRRRRLS